MRGQDMGDRPVRVGKFSHTFNNIYTCVQLQSEGYRLKRCSTAYENAPQCDISMEKSLKFSGEEAPLHASIP